MVLAIERGVKPIASLHDRRLCARRVPAPSFAWNGAGDRIEGFGDSDGKDASLASIERFAPKAIAFRKIGNRCRLTFERCHALLDRRLSEGQMRNVSLSVAVGNPRESDMNHRTNLSGVFDAENCEPGVGLVPGCLKFPNLAGAEFRG